MHVLGAKTFHLATPNGMSMKSLLEDNQKLSLKLRLRFCVQCLGLYTYLSEPQHHYAPRPFFSCIAIIFFSRAWSEPGIRGES